MKPVLSSLLILFSALSLNAQPAIPWATEQPAWVLPLYLSDANDNHDTIYVGYDPEAVTFNDEQFGEILHTVPDSLFQAYCYSFPSDTANALDYMKVDIKPDLPGSGFPVMLRNVQLPITIRWDSENFHSDSLPFPDIDPAPRADGVLWPGTMKTEDLACGYTEPIIFSDTATIYTGCTFDSTITLNDLLYWDAFLELVRLDLSVWAWDWYRTWIGVEEHEEGDILLYPSPTVNDLTLLLTETDHYRIRLIDLYGRILDTQMFTGTQVDISLGGIPPGQYLVEVSSQNHRSLHPFIKE